MQNRSKQKKKKKKWTWLISWNAILTGIFLFWNENKTQHSTEEWEEEKRRRHNEVFMNSFLLSYSNWQLVIAVALCCAVLCVCYFYDNEWMKAYVKY